MNDTAADLNPALTLSEPRHYFSHNSQGVRSLPQAQVTLRLGHLRLQVATAPGVFSKSHLDPGSSLLLQTFVRAEDFPTAAKLLDLGCGWGAIGCFLSQSYPNAIVAMCDINFRAAQLAAANANANHCGNAVTWCGDGAAAVVPGQFHAVLCNPPVRAGNDVIKRLFGDALRCTASGGSFWVVVRTAQGAKSWLKRLNDDWGNCSTEAISGGYRVLKSIKRTGADSYLTKH